MTTDDAADTVVTMHEVSHAYVRPDTGDRHISLSSIDLTVRAGEFFCLLGPSGCGKSTLLNVVAGFEPVSSGTVRAGAEVVTGPDASRGVVFQTDTALFGWLTVYGNAAYGPRIRGRPRAEYSERVDDALRLVHLWDHRHKFPRELSGGMRQRCQIARLLASDPEIMLMDEPFGALDAQTRRHLQTELADIWSQTGKTVIFVTHDVTEAVLLGDRVGVMTHGPGARMKRVVDVDLPRPRERTDGAFEGLVRSLTADLELGTEEGSDVR